MQDLQEEIYDLHYKNGSMIRFFQFSHQNQKSIVICNPLGLTKYLAHPLINCLGDEFRILTWETRGTHLAPGSPPISSGLELSDHVEDLVFLLRHFKINDRVDIVAHCSGAMPAIMFSAKYPHIVNKLILVAPAINIAEAKKTIYQKSLISTLESIENISDFFIEQIYRSIDEESRKHETLDGRLKKASAFPFRSAPAAKTYAAMLTKANNIDLEENYSNINNRTAIIHAVDDTMVHYNTSEFLARCIKNSTLKLYKSGEHFLFYTNEHVIEDIREFLKE